MIQNHFWKYKKVSGWLEKKPEDKAKFQKVFDEIHGNFNENLVDKAIRFLDKTIGKLYDDLHLETPYDFDLEELSKKHHVVLVPNHQSHADYIALTYLFYKKFRMPIFVAGGINLNIFLVGKFFRNAGAFFIRRKFGNDEIYKAGFEAYVFGLLESNRIVEFFFEGGRSRTGKLLSPRYGLFQTLLEAHKHVTSNKSLLFVPVSIAHEHLPEEKAHARELEGEKKVKEKSTQIFKIVKLFNKRLGSIHANIGHTIEVQKIETEDVKSATQRLAFDCFRAVGEGMPVTATSLLSLILLDNPSGAITWDQIEVKAIDIIAFCKRFSIPLGPALKNNWEEAKFSINKALNILINNKKLDVIQSDNLGDIYYNIKPEERVHILYFKNMILHHFLVPCIVSTGIYYLLNRRFEDAKHFSKFLIEKRDELKFEFYLPSTADMLKFALQIVNYSTGKTIESVDECMALPKKELKEVSRKVGHFSVALSYVHECYYLSASALIHLEKKEFSLDRFIEVFKEIYLIELNHGRVVQYKESYLLPLLKTSLDYFIHIKSVSRLEDGTHKISNLEVIQKKKRHFAEQLNVNIISNLQNHAID